MALAVATTGAEPETCDGTIQLTSQSNFQVRQAGGQSAVADPLLLGSMPAARLSNSDEPVSGSWTATGSLNTARYYHTATLLPNGKVLVAGGSPNGSSYLDSAELYDPTIGPNGTWSATGSLTTGLRGHQAATLLPNGKVLVAGGYNGS